MKILESKSDDLLSMVNNWMTERSTDKLRADLGAMFVEWQRAHPEGGEQAETMYDSYCILSHMIEEVGQLAQIETAPALN